MDDFWGLVVFIAVMVPLAMLVLLVLLLIRQQRLHDELSRSLRNVAEAICEQRTLLRAMKTQFDSQQIPPQSVEHRLIPNPIIEPIAAAAEAEQPVMEAAAVAAVTSVEPPPEDP